MSPPRTSKRMGIFEFSVIKKTSGWVLAVSSQRYHALDAMEFGCANKMSRHLFFAFVSGHVRAFRKQLCIYDIKMSFSPIYIFNSLQETADCETEVSRNHPQKTRIYKYRSHVSISILIQVRYTTLPPYDMRKAYATE